MANDFAAKFVGNRRAQAIFSYVMWYRDRYQISPLSGPDHDHNMSSGRQIVENLAREHISAEAWSVILTESEERADLYAYISGSVAWLATKGVTVTGWYQPEWEVNPNVIEIIDYLRDFRLAHSVDLANPRFFRTDDLEEPGRFILGQLLHLREFSSHWVRFEDTEYASTAAAYVRTVLRPRLLDYQRRPRVAAAS